MILSETSCQIVLAEYSWGRTREEMTDAFWEEVLSVSEGSR